MGVLASYSGLTSEAYALELRLHRGRVTLAGMGLFEARRAHIEAFAGDREVNGRVRATIARRWRDLPPVDLGWACSRSRVGQDPTPPHRLTEFTAQHRMVVTDRRRRYGAREENRTPDLRITSALLYRLSYPGDGQQC